MMVKKIRRDIKLTKWARMLLVVLFVAGMISSVQAATVIWVSDGHETISAGVADDHKWVELLAANGYVVQREDVTMQDSEGGPNLSVLNDAGLVIISRDAGFPRLITTFVPASASGSSVICIIALSNSSSVL